MTTDTDAPSPFTVVGAAVYDAATDSLEGPNRWESAGKLTAPDGYRREYRDTL